MKNKIMKRVAIFGLAFGIGGVAYASTTVVAPQFKWMTLLVFAAIIAITMFVTYLAARSTTSTSEFYAAGRSVSGIQNGWAIAGDFLSAASFLGITGLIALYGYDGFMYSVGWLVGYITVLLVIAEPCRNIGKYTMGDILAFRNDPKKTKTVAAISTIVVSTFYLTAQMVGGGVLIKTLIGIDYEISVVGVGILMLAYVVFGGMKATTWVQIIKAMMLVTASLVLVTLVWAPYGFSLPGYLGTIVNDPNVQQQVARLLGDRANTMTALELGQRFLEPGLFLKNPIDQISLGMALVFGTAGMPHILMRFFTVPTAQAARTSVIWAMAIIGGFYVCTLFLGTGAAMLVGSTKITAIDAGGNMAAPLLAQFLGGGENSILGNFFLAFVAAVAFATIVAVVAGLVLASASAMAHDIYVGVIRGEKATPQEQVVAARVSSIVVGILAIFVGIMAKGQNVAHLVGLAFSVAASSNLPCIFLTLYWKRCNTWGIICGMIGGTMMAIVLVMISPNMTYPKAVIASASKVLNGDVAQAGKPAVPGARERLVTLKAKLDATTDAAEKKAIEADLTRVQRTHDKAVDDLKNFEGKTTSIVGLEKPLISLKNPGLISIPFGFLMVILFSLLTRDKRSEEMWDELYVRQNTGINAEKATVH